MDFHWTGPVPGRQGRRMLAALLALPAMLGGARLDAASIRGVDVDARSVTLRFDDPVPRVSAILLDGPTRIAVDVDGAQSGQGGSSGGVVSAVRHGQRAPDTARVVFDLVAPAVISDAHFAEDGRSLTFLLSPVDADHFSSSAQHGRRTFLSPIAFRARPPQARSSVRVPIEPPAPISSAVPLPAVSGTRGTNRPLVVIDAGHGGHDPGSIGVHGEHEKDAALAIAKAIRDELVRSGRVRVAMTRDDDRFLVLGERREIARRLNADLFISVHADSAPNAEARGASIYTLSEVASDRYAAQLAARENRADVLNGIDLGGENAAVSSILFDLAQRETMNISATFAQLMHREMIPAVPFKSDFHRFAGLVVLKAPDVPSVLLETGYMSNEDDVHLLFSRDYQHDIAVGVRRAVETHFARRLAGSGSARAGTSDEGN